MAGFKNPSPQRTPPLAPAIPTRGSSSSPTTLRQQQAHPRSSPVQSTFLSSPYLSQASRPRVNQLVSFDDLANAVENLGTTISVAQLRDTWVTQEEWSAASKQQQQQQQRQQHQEQKQHHGRRHHTLSSPTDDALLPSSRGVSGGARNDSILTAVAALGSAIRTAASAVVIVVYRDGSTTVRPTTLSQRKRYRGWVRAALGNVLAAGGRAASTSTSTSSSASGGGVVSTLTSSPLSAALKRPTPITSPERTRSSSSSSSSSSSVSPSTLRHPAHAARSFLSGALSVAAQDLIHVHSDVAAQAGTELTEHDITTFACEVRANACLFCRCSYAHDEGMMHSDFMCLFKASFLLSHCALRPRSSSCLLYTSQSLHCRCRRRTCSPSLCAYALILRRKTTPAFRAAAAAAVARALIPHKTGARCEKESRHMKPMRATLTSTRV